MTAVELDERNALAIGDAYFGSCQLIHDFIGGTVRPIVDRETNVLPWTKTCNGMITRVHGWLRSLGKLNHPGDFQAIMAGTRALFEIAVDFALIKHEEQGSFAKLIAWEDSARLDWARKLSRRAPEQHAFAAQFVRDNQERVVALRRLHWADPKHRGRWTGRTLRDDAETAERLGRAAQVARQPEAEGLVEYYDERYSRVCWHVHGSGLIGLRDAQGAAIPMIVAQGFRDAAHFSLMSSRFVLDLMGKFDEVTQVRFQVLNDELLRARGSVYLTHRLPSSS